MENVLSLRHRVMLAYINGRQQGLPARYQKVEYLQSSQTSQAWLNLGQVWNDNMKVEMEFKELQNVTTIVGSYWAFGSYSGKYFSLGPQKNASGGHDIAYRLGTSIYQEYNFRLDQTIWNTIVMDTTTITYNGTSYALVGTYQKPSIDFLLFGANYGSGTPYRIDRLQLFTLKSFKIYNGNTLTHDYVPCYDTENNNKPGMYDLVSRQFLVNQGTGADFIVGPDVHDLPAEFQEVEYLQSSGTQWIDTGIKPYSGMVVEYEASKLDNLGNCTDFGVYSGANVFIGIVSTKWRVGNGNGYITSQIVADSNRHKFKYSISDTLSLELDDVVIASGDFMSSIYETNQNTMWIFATNNNGAIHRSVAMKIYNFKIGNHKFIPCYRKTTLVAGMYDLITKQFKTNSGTGSFIVGPDIN